jgi:multidrug resistance efflux pump
MMSVLLGMYVAILALFVWLRFISLNTFWKLSPVIVLILLTVPMGWGAPSGPVAVLRNSVQIVPSLAGEVIEVPVAANTTLKSGDVLFRIDPAPYDATVKALQAQLKLAEQRLGEMTQLATRGTGRQFDVEQRPSRARPAQGAARWRAVESRQDHDTRAGRRLCDQPRPAQGGARHRAVAGDGVH